MEIREYKKLVLWYFKNLSRSLQQGLSVVRFHFSEKVLSLHVIYTAAK